MVRNMILITGGARSGKSTFAEKLAMQREAEPASTNGVLYIATAWSDDGEMQARILKHQQSRPKTWQTYETHQNSGNLIAEKSQLFSVIILECITTMLTNLIFDEIGDQSPENADFIALEETLNSQINQLLQGCILSESNDCQVIIVTNELGLGIVPDNIFARQFRDIAGRVNQRLAQNAQQVYFVVSGIEIMLKG